ncbi:outer membrane beta-barrel protein [Chitinophaga sp. 22321]|uniref:Outer membrane beta-barrel protein n=1 Tax=Chitinophaga hostae TaxID=2831022 RepID=A0ABS5IWU7_9BACT|nr:outer membrane beta-barrel protein [Chitinophaga hostae]MBS0027328.1 outer membrane beta-barrel protein [Chitinophaga hostae]
MRTRTFLVVLLYFISGLPASAQLSMGLETGMTRNHLYTSLNNRSNTAYEAVNGWLIGVPVTYQFNSWLGIQADPLLMQKNYRLRRTGYYDGVYHQNNNYYLKLPVMAQLCLQYHRLQLFLHAGGYVAWWMAGRIKGVQPAILNNADPLPADEEPDNILQMQQAYAYHERYTFDARKDRRIELGGLAGLGAGWQLPSGYHLFVEVRYCSAWNQHQKPYMIRQPAAYNETLMIMTGCRFYIAKRKRNENAD